MKHNNECKCEICESGFSKEEALKRMLEVEKEQLEKHGWIVHLISEDITSPTGYNLHTHGLQKYNHLDFQIVLPLNPKSAHNIIRTFVERVKNGEKFVADQKVDEIIKNYKVKLISAQETGREVLRVIFPDADGNLEIDTIEEKYAIQHGTSAHDW